MEEKNTENVEKNIEIVADTEKELDSFAIEERVREKVKKDFEQEKVLSEEAERISYLKTLDLESVEDLTTRKVIEEVLESKLQRKDKVESIKKLVCQSSILSCLKKTENLEPGKVNSFALKTLKSLKNLGKNLSETQIVQSETAISTIDVDLQRMGKENLSRGLDAQVDIESLTPVEKLKFLMKKHQNQELEKRSKAFS